ncbi:hypothetical protein D3C73_818560 [compost metagenome]
MRQPTRPQHFSHQRSKQADKTNHPNGIHQHGAEDNCHCQRAETRHRQPEPKIACHAIIQAQQRQWAQQQHRQQPGHQQARQNKLYVAPVLLIQRSGTPQEHPLQLIVIEQRQQAVDRTAVQSQHQPGQDQRHRRHAFAPGHAEHQSTDHDRPRHGGQLASQLAAGQHPQRSDSQPKLGTGGNAKRCRLRQRIAQNLLEQHADQSQPGTGQQRDRQPRQQAIVEQHLLHIVDVRRHQRLPP